MCHLFRFAVRMNLLDEVLKSKLFTYEGYIRLLLLRICSKRCYSEKKDNMERNKLKKL